MTSVASGMEQLYDFGPGSSNPSRYHTAEQARETDDLARTLYSHHPQMRVVGNFPDFEQKIDSALGFVFEGPPFEIGEKSDFATPRFLHTPHHPTHPNNKNKANNIWASLGHLWELPGSRANYGWRKKKYARLDCTNVVEFGLQAKPFILFVGFVTLAAPK